MGDALLSTRGYVILGVVALAVVVAIVIGLNVGGDPESSPSAEPSLVSASPSASSAPPSAAASASQIASAEPTAPAAVPTLTWEQLPSPEPGAEVHGVAVVEGRWFALGRVELAPAIWTSDDDGTTWTPAEVESERTEQEYTIVTDLVVFGDELLAFGRWGADQSDQAAWVMWRSTDGATWTETRSIDVAFSTVVAGGPGLVGVRSFGAITPFDSTVAVSSDGETWEDVEPPAFASAAIDALAVVGERIVAVGHVFGPPERMVAAWYTDDGGQSWEPATGIEGLGGAGGVVVNRGALVAVGGEVPTAWVSTDGATWSAFPMGGEGQPTQVAPVANGVVAAGSLGIEDVAPPRAWVSADGQAWEPSEISGDGSVFIEGMAAGEGVVIVGGACRTVGCESVLWRGTAGN